MVDIYHAKTTDQPDVSVHGLDSSVCAWYEEFGVHEFLYCQDDAVFYSETDSGAMLPIKLFR